MLKNILDLEGAQELSNTDKKNIMGGIKKPPLDCGGVGFVTSESSCLSLGYAWEIATGCCYNFSG